MAQCWRCSLITIATAPTDMADLRCLPICYSPLLSQSPLFLQEIIKRPSFQKYSTVNQGRRLLQVRLFFVESKKLSGFLKVKSCDQSWKDKHVRGQNPTQGSDQMPTPGFNPAVIVSHQNVLFFAPLILPNFDVFGVVFDQCPLNVSEKKTLYSRIDTCRGQNKMWKGAFTYPVSSAYEKRRIGVSV